jgi:hypothetical protein
MSFLTRFALFAAAFWLSPVAAFAQGDARKIIEQSAAAHGGSKLLTQFPAARVKVKGTLVVNGQPTTYSGESVYWLPDRVHNRIEFSGQSVPQVVEQTLNGDRMAMSVCGLTQQVSESQGRELKMALYCRELERLSPLLNHPEYKLRAIGEKSILDKRVTGVRVSRAGFQDVTLYFDPTTHLLHSLERPGIDAKGDKVEQQEVFLEFKEAGGIKYPSKTKVKQNGHLVLESEVVEFVPLERVDAKIFAIPQ